MQSSALSPEEQRRAGGQCAAALSSAASALEQFDAYRQMREGLQAAKEQILGDGCESLDVKEVEEYLAREADGALGCPSGTAGDGRGPGTGGRGMGRGGDPLEEMSATAAAAVRSPSQVSRGAILHQMFVYGVPEKGEALEAYTNIARAAKQEAANSLARNRVPREYEELVKSYFDALDVTREED